MVGDRLRGTVVICWSRGETSASTQISRYQELVADERKGSKNFHDRFLIIDDKELYLIGASLKDLGWKCFTFTKLAAAEIPNLKARV